jgi:RNA polymerase sigma factor (sigma-70 family)
MMTRNAFLATHRVYLKRMARAFSRSERLPARRELVADELFSDVALALLERWDMLSQEQKRLSAAEPKFRNRMFRNLFSAALKGRAQERFERGMLSTSCAIGSTRFAAPTNIEDGAVTSEASARLSVALEDLGAKEREAIELKFGFDGEGARTLSDVGKIMRVSHQRASRLVGRALEKLRTCGKRGQQ